MSNKDSTLWVLIALLVVVVMLFFGSGMMGFGKRDTLGAK